MELLKDIARQNFSRWNAALQSKDPKHVASLYIADATFLPTVSGDFKKGEAGAREYFAHFLEKNPSGTIVEEEVQSLGPNCYLHSGMYDFEIGPANDKQIVKARFSFIWGKNQQGKWKILHHHSSIKPKA